jgi:acylphosphatase
VQGVGFRYRTSRVARGFAVTGWVRNLRDGRVEMEAEGAQADVDAFLAAIQAEMAANIESTDVEWLAATGEDAGFGIH